ncbi:AMP-binding protein [Mycobacterium sp. NPDC050853]|uniref:AMP-binding protein n=1 Tax=Mycobacterium sp. NPDC050853 TaxID=3155160 RepID=UPI0033D78099
MTRAGARLMATMQNGFEVLRLGGLRGDTQPSPFSVVEQTSMYRLRHYFPGSAGVNRPVVLLAHPMMVSANMFDVNRQDGAVGILHARGTDVWVIDFGNPNRIRGGMKRTFADHVVAVSAAVDTVHRLTGRPIHLAGYSQGGMFCYTAAALRKCQDIASVITFGAPVDAVAALPMGIPADLGARGASLLAGIFGLFGWLSIPGWLARIGFELMTPIKTLRNRLGFLFQLHNREALLPREQQRRFLGGEGWIAWSGPAVAEFLRQFVTQNRMMSGGFVIDDQLVTLTDITCPVLAFIGDADDIGQPVSVRGIGRAAPRAEVYESTLPVGHFGLIVGSGATTSTWPTVAQWIPWVQGSTSKPAGIVPMPTGPVTGSGVTITKRVSAALSAVYDSAAQTSRVLFPLLLGAPRRLRQVGFTRLAVEAVRTLPRLNRLDQIHPSTQISLGRLLSEQAQRAPSGECFLFEDRVHTNESVHRRVDNVVKGLIHSGVRQQTRVGVLMDTRPSALVAIAALSRLGAVAVLLAPDGDLAECARLGEITTLLCDPPNLEGARRVSVPVLVLGGGETRELALPANGSVVDMEKIRPGAVTLPGWYRPNPGKAQDLAFVMFSSAGGQIAAKHITNQRWALSAFGTASAAALTSNDTVYCLTPLHHQAGLLVSLGGAVAGGARIALARSLDPAQFGAEIRRYGVTVVCYTWAMLREILDHPALTVDPNHPVRMFIGSGMPIGLWQRVLDTFAPARVLEFFTTTEGEAVLANVASRKIGSKGRSLPGSGRVKLAKYDVTAGQIIDDANGLAAIPERGEVGLLLAKPRGRLDAGTATRHGVFEAGDSWVTTDFLFSRDADGDYWLADSLSGVVHTARGPVFTQPITDALNTMGAVDLAVTFQITANREPEAMSVVSLRSGKSLTTIDLNMAMSTLDPHQRPRCVRVVKEIALSASYRPLPPKMRTLPRSGAGVWLFNPTTRRYDEKPAAARKPTAGTSR